MLPKRLHYIFGIGWHLYNAVFPISGLYSDKVDCFRVSCALVIFIQDGEKPTNREPLAKVQQLSGH